MLKMQLIFILLYFCSLAYSTNTEPDQTSSASKTPNFKDLPTGRKHAYPANRSKEYKTESERVKARRVYRSKYQAQFNEKNIEIAKNTLTGTNLQIFLEKAKNFREKRRERYKNSKVKGTQVKQQVKTPKRKAEEVQPTPTTATQDNSKKERKILSNSQIMMREADIRAANKAVWSQLK